MQFQSLQKYFIRICNGIKKYGCYLPKRLFWGKRSILSLNVLFYYMLSQVQQLSKLQYRFRSADALQRTTTGVQLSSEWPAVYIGNSFCKDQKIFPKTTTVHCFCDRFWPFLVFLWSTIIMKTKQYRLVSCEFRTTCLFTLTVVPNWESTKPILFSK